MSFLSYLQSPSDSRRRQRRNSPPSRLNRDSDTQTRKNWHPSSKDEHGREEERKDKQAQKNSEEGKDTIGRRHAASRGRKTTRPPKVSITLTYRHIWSGNYTEKTLLAEMETKMATLIKMGDAILASINSQQ